MRLLADENFPGLLVASLRIEGHDVLWARTDCTGWKDVTILERAESESRILLTLDKDFWRIALQRRVPLEKAGVVLFRVHPATIEKLQPIVGGFLKANRKWAGHVCIISPGGIQMVAARK